MRTELKLLLKISIILILVTLLELFNYKITIYKNTTFDSSYTLVILIINNLVYIVIGVVLGLENILKEIKKKGYWKFNIKRFVIVFLPGLVLAYLPIIIFYIPIIYIPQLDIFYNNLNNMVIFGITSGFVLSTCFTKPYLDDEKSNII